MPTRDKDRDAIFLFTDALVESVLEDNDETVLEEVAARGEDPHKRAQAIRDGLLGDVAAFRRSELRDVRKGLDEAERRREGEREQLPEALQELRELLSDLIAAKPGLESGVTLQFRDLQELSAEDMVSVFHDLIELGVIDAKGKIRGSR